MEWVLKNADISILSNFLAILFKFFHVLSTCQISDKLQLSKQKLQRGQAESALPRPYQYQSAKGPTCLGLNLRLHKYIGTHFNGMVLHFWDIEYVGNAVYICFNQAGKPYPPYET